MEITGRIAKDAVVTQLKDERKVTNFTVVINDYFKPKNSSEGKTITTYVNCSYWINSALVSYLKKGMLIEVAGRIGVQTYTSKSGETKAALTLHVNNIKLHGGSNGGHGGVVSEEQQGNIAIPAPVVTEPADDLPF